MIGKGKSISHLKASINYVLGRDGAEVLDKNIISETATGVVNEFRMFQQVNDRCERNVLSFVISPSTEDGKRLSREGLEEINKRFLEKMKLEDHQYIAFVHKNTEHKHIHLYVNRVGYDGKAYQDRFVGRRSSEVAADIAKEMGLVLASEVQQVRRRERAFENPCMEKIRELSKASLGERDASSIPKFVAVFNEAGAASSLRAEAYHNNSGVFQGLRFYAGEEKFKASEIDRSLSKGNLEYYFEKMNASVNKERHVENNSLSIASGALGLLGSLMHAGLDANRASRVEHREEEEEKEKEKSLANKRGFGMGR